MKGPDIAGLGAGPPTAPTDRAAADLALGNYEAARARLEAALATMVGGRGDHAPELLPILNDLTHLHLKLGELKSAWKCAERALKISETTFGMRSIELAEPLGSLVEAYFSFGLLDKCYLGADRALAILRSALGEHHPDVAKACDRLGVVLAEMGAYPRARALHLRALEIMRAHGQKDWLARILANVAATHLAAGEPEAARPLYEEALATAHAVFGVGHASTGTYLALFGDFCAKVGEERRALELYGEALAVERGALGETHPDVATLLLKIGQQQYRQDPTSGRVTIFRAIAILGSHQHRPRVFTEAYLLLAQLLQPSSAAILFWKLAINDIESMRLHVARLDRNLERTFLRQNEDDFRRLGDSLIYRGRLPEAQQVLTMIKERELFGLTRLDVRRTKVSLTPLEVLWMKRGEALLGKIRTSLQDAAGHAHGVAPGDQAASLGAKIDQAGKDLAAWFDDLVVAFAAAEVGAEGQGENLPALALSRTPWQAPGAGNALLQYLLAPDHRSLGIILTTSSLQREHRVALTDGELNKLVYSMRDAIAGRSAGFLADAQRLYQILIAPVADDLRSGGIGTLALSLDGVLRYLPIAALHDGQRYLIEQFALVLVTSAVGPQGRSQSEAVRRAAGLGVSRPVAGYRPLTGVREELAAVIRAGGEGGGVLPGVIRLDEAFTAQALHQALSPQNSVIHVASHFVFEAAHEGSSYLLLGDGTKLTLAELAELRFDALDLMVLSACNTAIGGGHRQSGREIEGLGAVVRHNGARKVLATLWPVADLTTAALMRAFYHNRYEAGLDPAEALRRAQLGLLTDALQSLPGGTRCLVDPDDEAVDRRVYPGTSHPFFWAPYILMGEAPEASGSSKP